MNTEEQMQEQQIENVVISNTSDAMNKGQEQQIVKVIVKEEKSNGMGTAGFVLSLISLILCWVPVISWILCALGSIFSFIGVFRRPRGLAIAGLIISGVCFFIIYVYCIVILEVLAEDIYY